MLLLFVFIYYYVLCRHCQYMNINFSKMYLCLWGGRPRIVECQMDGKECSTLYEVPRGSPNYIAVNSRELAVVGDSSRESHVMKYLYWTDSKLDSIEFLTLEHEMHGRTQLLNFRFVAISRSKKFNTKQKKPWTTCINIKKINFSAIETVY